MGNSTLQNKADLVSQAAAQKKLQLADTNFFKLPAPIQRAAIAEQTAYDDARGMSYNDFMAKHGNRPDARDIYTTFNPKNAPYQSTSALEDTALALGAGTANLLGSATATGAAIFGDTNGPLSQATDSLTGLADQATDAYSPTAQS